MDSDDKHDTDYANKFVRKAEEIFAGLPKPKDWHTQEEIAGAVEVPQQTIADWMKDFTEKLAADNSVKWTDFDPPIYNVWKQQGIPPTCAGAPSQNCRTVPSCKYSPHARGSTTL